MKVVQLSKFYPPAVGGIENNVRQVARMVVRGGGEAIVIASNHDYTRRRTTTEDDAGVHVLRLPTLGRVLSLPLTIGWIRALRRQRRGAVLHLHAPNPLAEFACLMAAGGRPIVITDHGLVQGNKPASGLRAAMYRALLKRSSAIVTYTQSFADASPEVSRFRQKVRVIPHAMDAAEFGASGAVMARVETIRKGDPRAVVLFVGRLVHYKGLHILLEAFDEVRTPSRLIIVGGGPEGTRLKEMAGRMKRSADVEFVGEVAHGEVAPYYHAAAVLALPALSAQESFGQAVLEAALCGVPTIATDRKSVV